jgi:hypothetical protein
MKQAIGTQCHRTQLPRQATLPATGGNPGQILLATTTKQAVRAALTTQQATSWQKVFDKACFQTSD